MATGNTKTRISRSLSDLDPDALAGKARRNDAIKLRVTTELKERIQADAESVGLNMSELLLGLYEHASPRLRRKRR